LAFSLKENGVGCVLLGPDDGVREGGEVRRSGHSLRVPAGDSVLGRVLDAVCRPLDGGDPSREHVAAHRAPCARRRAAAACRSSATHRHEGDRRARADRAGQRELIIGDRKLGKTTIAIDTISRRKARTSPASTARSARKPPSVRQVVATLEQYGALEYTAVIVALPGDMPALRYVAPYTACALGEYFRDQGGDALVVFDDLTKHAVTYREMSALLERPVGREAYPGDVFYVHSRLLERAARMSQEHGGGSLSALPIVETLAGDISAFIPTNIISICDGQIMLDGIRVQRGATAGHGPGSVGVACRRRRPVSGDEAGRRAAAHRLGAVQRDGAFVKFGAEVDEATQLQLTRGERARELLKQEQHVPMSLGDEALVLFAW